MPSLTERSMFRRLIGDFGVNDVVDSDVDLALNDATYELTSMSGINPTTTNFDVLNVQYHPEVVYKAAINWWWQYATSHGEKYSMSMGSATQNVEGAFTRAMTMIEKLQAHYQQIQELGIELSDGNYSRFSKRTLTRLGGQSEENALQSLNS